jgi:hypothetical protein
MTIADLDIWAATGTSVTPPPVKFTLGWTLGEQPAYEYENHLHKETRLKINAMLAELNGIAHITEHSDFSLPIIPIPNQLGYIATQIDENEHQSNTPIPINSVIENICRKSYYVSPMNTHMNSSANEIDLGSGEYIKSIEIGLLTSPFNKRAILMLCANDNSVHVYDPNDMSLIDDSGALTGLPSGSGETWVAESMVCDGYWVYVIFKNTNVSPNETHVIQAYQISDWSVRTGWPATGTILPGTGVNPDFPTDNPCNMCFPKLGKIATINHWTLISVASTPPAISIIDTSNGSIDASGAGDAPGGHSFSSICGDGTFVYFGVEQGGATGYICSAQISNPLVGCGGANYPYSPGSLICWDNLFDGKVIVSAWKGSNPSILHFSTVLEANEQTILTVGSRYEDYELTYLAFDGLYYYVIIVDAISNNRNNVVKLNPGTFGNSTAILDDFILSSHVVEPTANAWQTVGRLATDGRDVFHVLEHKSGTWDGKVRRVFKATAR